MSIQLEAESADDVPTPPDGAQALFLDSSTGLWSTMDSSRTVTPLGGS